MPGLFLTMFCCFGPDTEKLVLEAGNGLPSWKFNDQLFPCDVCGKVFGRQQTLSRHLSLHTGESGPRCPALPSPGPQLVSYQEAERIVTGSGGHVFVPAFSSHFTSQVQIEPWKRVFVCIERTHRVQVGLMEKDAHIAYPSKIPRL